jgi:hypothetical protein
MASLWNEVKICLTVSLPPSPLGHLVSTAFLLVPLSICRVASGLCLRESDQFMLSIILGRKLFYSMLMKAAQCMFGLYQL